jgi:hypothetical protein
MNMIHRWRDRDVKRLLKATRDAGLVAQAIEIETQTGIVRVITAGDLQQTIQPEATLVETRRRSGVRRHE